jgi:hypothetical protein
MSAQSSADRFAAILRAVQSWDTHTWSAELRRHPEYPEYAHPVGSSELDQYNRDLLQRAWIKTADSGDQRVGDEELLRPRTKCGGKPKLEKINRNMAVYRIDGTVFQLVGKRTIFAHKVLGRIGVIDIYLDKLREKLKDSNVAPDHNISDLTRVVAGEEYPDPATLSAKSKPITRLNAGEFVSEDTAGTIAKQLGVRIADLVFDGSIYDNKETQRGSARKRRRKEIQDQLRKERKELKAYRVKMDPLNATGLQSIKMMHCAKWRYDRIDDDHHHHKIKNDQHCRLCELPEEQKKAVSDFLAAIVQDARVPGRRRAINETWVELERTGLQVWAGSYENLIPLHNRDLGFNVASYGQAKSYTEKVLVIAIAERGTNPPPKKVDLSHTVDLTPSVEQLLAGEPE